MDSLYLASGGAALEVQKLRLEQQKQQEKNILDRQNQYNQNRLAEDQSKASAFDLEKQKYVFEETKRARAQEIAENNLISMAFKEQSKDRLTENEIAGESNLSNTFRSIADKLIDKNPKRALDFYTKSNEFETKATEKAIQGYNLRAEKITALGDLAGTVIDSESAREAIVDAAKLGITIPVKYAEYNDQTKEYWQNRALFSKTYSASIKAEAELLRAQNDKTYKEESIKVKKLELDAKARKEQLTQNKIEIARNANIKFAPKAEQNQIRATLKATSDVFDSASDEDQKTAVDDVYFLAQYIKLNEGVKDSGIALDIAKQRVLESFAPDGTYARKATPTPAPAVALATPATVAPASSNYIVERVYSDNAPKVNLDIAVTPTTQEAFNALEKGQLYINPKDNKQYRKK